MHIDGDHFVTRSNVEKYAGVTSIGGDAYIRADCPALTSIGGDAYIRADCPALTSIGGDADIRADCPALGWIEGVRVWPREKQIAHRRKIAPILLDEEKLDMDIFGVEDGNVCGTTACMAGWAQDQCDDPTIKSLTPQSAGAITLGTDVARMFFEASDDEAREVAREWLKL